MRPLDGTVVLVASQIHLLRIVSAVASESAIGVEMTPYRIGVATGVAVEIHRWLDQVHSPEAEGEDISPDTFILYST